MNTNTLRELSRAASPAPWSILGGPEDYAVYIDGAKNIGYDGELIRPNAALIVALRNDAEKYADLRDAVDAYRVAKTQREWMDDETFDNSVKAEQDAEDAMFAALAAFNGGAE